MAVSAIGGTTGHGSPPGLPAGAGTDPTDFLVLGVGNHDSGSPVFTFDVPGWTELSEDNTALGGNGLGFALFVAPASAGAPAISASHGGYVAVLGAYRGVRISNPVIGPGALMGPISGGVNRFLPSPGHALTGSAVVGVLMVADNVGPPSWGGNPPNEPAGSSIASVQEVSGQNSSIHQGYREGLEGEEPAEWLTGAVGFEPEPPTTEIELRVAWSVVDQGIGRALLLRPA